MKILFVGESWLGSCARSLREALARRPDIELDEINEDAWFTKPHSRALRALNRLAAPTYRHEFNQQVLGCIRAMQPDVVMTYKGVNVYAPLLRAIREAGAITVNVYPDCSPHAHGQSHRTAVGSYDLVISTKPYHPSIWHDTYGYDNRCVFVPQGYDPNLHLVDSAPAEYAYDVVMVASHRSEYGDLMRGFADAMPDSGIRVAIGGSRWDGHHHEFPPHWHFLGMVSGRNYVSTLRQGKICIAPLTRDVVINGQRQPGDVDTTRTYELAAAHCFFIHRRTSFVQSLYDEAHEVPMFDDADELARQVCHFLDQPEERAAMASAAHQRAVPDYSVDQRAGEIVEAIKAFT